MKREWVGILLLFIFLKCENVRCYQSLAPSRPITAVQSGLDVRQPPGQQVK